MVIIDALDVLCTQLMHDLFAIAKFLLVTVYFLVVNLHHDHLDTTETTEVGRYLHGNTACLNKNLAIANRSPVSCADNTLKASIGLNITPLP